MNGVTEQRGLSARQKTPKNLFKLLTTPFWVFISLTFFISACQSNGQDGAQDRSATASDSPAKPKVNIKVNKHYDNKGNVVGFDSTYTSYYSNVEGDTVRMDSLMKSFDSHFNLGQTSFFGSRFDSLFFDKSLRYPDFFHKDFFLRRYELNDPYMRNMMRSMDSLKNDFYQKHSSRNHQSKDL